MRGPVSGYIDLDDLAIDCQYAIYLLDANVCAFMKYAGLTHPVLNRLMQGETISEPRHAKVKGRVSKLLDTIRNLHPDDLNEYGRMFDKKFALNKKGDQ